MRLLPDASVLALAGLLAGAVEPSSTVENACVTTGQGEACASSADCADYAFATECVDFEVGDNAYTCQIPCEATDEFGVTAESPATCALGETCVQGVKATGSATTTGWWCKPERFRMDLNLLDQTITHFIEGVAPAFASDDCSLSANLTALMDQDGDGGFDVYDVDLAVLAFLEAPIGCDPADELGVVESLRCDDALTYCEDDAECGDGLFCDAEITACTRECGLIASREEAVDSLERTCTGALKTCDPERGRCLDVPIDVLQQLTCSVDADCTAGAYCFLGFCAPNCYRAVDCPDSSWHCSSVGKCRIVPPPATDPGFVFDPANYAVRFVSDELAVDDLDTSDSSDLAIIDLTTRRQIVSNPAVVFGYRVTAEYGLKQDAQCTIPFVDDCDDENLRPEGETAAECWARQEDCFVDPETESWLILESAFGTVSGATTPTLGVDLDTAVAENLSAGVYAATLKIVFDNGDADSIDVRYTRASISGSYLATLSIKGVPLLGSGASVTLTGNRDNNFSIDVFADEEDTVAWTDLMAEHNIPNTQGSFSDLNEGLRVTALLDASTSALFARNGPGVAGSSEIPFVGIHQPDTGWTRLLGVVDIAEEFCVDEDGNSCTASEVASSSCESADVVEVRNPFGRQIRRQIELFGVFDPASATLSGSYVESIAGLFPSESVTVEGEFRLLQTAADNTPLNLETTLLSADDSFVDKSLTDAKDAVDLLTICAGVSGGPDALPTDAEAFLSQVDAIKSFTQTVSFRSLVEDALSALDARAGTQDEARRISIYDFVADWIEPCDSSGDDAVASNTPVCLDEAAARCSLALYRQAILSGGDVGFDATAVQTSSDSAAGELPLFCDPAIKVSGCAETYACDGCDDETAGAQLAQFVLQDHNRHWSLLAQSLKFQADRARSDAFLTLFRNLVDPFGIQSALSFKNDKLRFSLCRYEQALDLFVGLPAVATLSEWPARAFESAGGGWVDLMHTIVADRMEVIAELIDLRRRVLWSTDGADFDFAQHLLQHEYLVQVYLMQLQAKWQEELFAYEGQAPAVLEKGEGVLAQLNPNRNRVGMVANRVFFENSDTSISNWRNFRELIAGSGGLLDKTTSQVGDAVSNLQGALSDLDSFEKSLLGQRQSLEAKLEGICGSKRLLEFGAAEDLDPEALASLSELDYCQAVMEAYWEDTETWDSLLRCKLGRGEEDDECDGDLLSSVSCEEAKASFDDDADYCEGVIDTFVSAVPVLHGEDTDPRRTRNPVECRLEGTTIDINGQDRPCAGGWVGRLLQERAVIETKRKQIIEELGSMIAAMNRYITYHDYLEIRTDAVQGVSLAVKNAIAAYDIIKKYKETGFKVVGKYANGAKCQVIAGMAFGTDCPGSAFAAATSAGLEATNGHFDAAIMALKAAFTLGSDVIKDELDQQKTLAGRHLTLSKMVGSGGLLRKLQLWNQESFNLALRIADQRQTAQAAADRYAESVAFAAEHLVGRESGFALLGDHLVAEAAEGFRRLVALSYKMAVAFVHHYNLPDDEAEGLVNLAMSAVTLEDVSNFVVLLDSLTQDYCGVEGIDCDAASNQEVLRFSLREQLYGDLTDIIDPQTGEVVTAGQQFHNLVTSLAVERRFRGAYVVDQIEVPFALPLTAVSDGAGGERWLIDPLSCNHLLDAGSDGNLALNAVGTNLGDGKSPLRYQMVRGETDYIRACQLESVQSELGALPEDEYPIRSHIVGYAPQNALNSLEEIPTFFTVSSSFKACVNSDGGQEFSGASCWRYFARDRSLSSWDWKLVVPVAVDGVATENAWILGEGLDDEDKPVVEDLEVYFRYRSRPVTEL
jgi:hypothetical protein